MTVCSLDAGAGAPEVDSHQASRSAALGSGAALVLAFCVAVLGCAVFVSGAWAAQTHVFASSFDGSDSAGHTLSTPGGLGVDQSTGDVYVVDTANDRVEKFSAAGAFITAFGTAGSGAGQLSGPSQVAVDNSSPMPGAIYVLDAGNNRIVKFSAAGAYLATINGPGGGTFGTARAIATDTAGNVWVEDDRFGLTIEEFTSTGADGPIGPIVTGRGTGAIIAVDASGNVYAQPGDGGLEKFDNAGIDTGIEIYPPAGANAVATDLTSDDLYVAAATEVDYFPAPVTGNTPADHFGTDHLTQSSGIAVNAATGTVYVADAGNGRVSVFTGPVTIPDATTNPADAVVKETATLNGHLDPAGGGAVSACVFQYTSDATFQSQGYAGASTVACDQPTPIAAATDVTAAATGLVAATTYHFRLLATDAQGTGQGQDQTFTTDLAADLTIGAADPVGATSATLNGHVDSTGSGDITACHFEYTDDATFQTSGFTGAQTQPCTPATPIPAPSDVSAAITGLAPDTTYHVRIVATDVDGTTTTGDQAFTTLALPHITDTAAMHLTTTEADLTAKINPRGADTTYHFEWGTDTSYGTSVPNPAAGIGDGTTDVLVSQHLTGLRRDTTYHFRLVATSANGTTTGPDHTFIYDAAGQGLPDGRAYEMVTPPRKNAALVGGAFIVAPADLADDGSRMIKSSIQCFGGSLSCTATRQMEGEPFAFDRTSSGWVTTPLAPPVTPSGSNSSWMYSANTTASLYSSPNSLHGEDDWIVRHPDGSFSEMGPVTDPSAGALGYYPFGSTSRIASADLSRLVWNAGQPFWSFDPGQAAQYSVYEYAGFDNTQPVLVGVTGGAGSTDLISTCGTVTGGTSNGARPGVLSADGHTVYVTVSACASGAGVNASTPVPADAIYARIDGSRTVAISQRSPDDCTTVACQTSPAQDADFQGASNDGSRVFFTSTQQLTDDATQDPLDGAGSRGDSSRLGCFNTTGANGCNLYLYDDPQHGPTGHNLIDVSAGDSSGHGPRVQGTMAISTDGTHVYFVAAGVLTSTPNGNGAVARDGAKNLYLYERDAVHPNGRTVFVARLIGDHQAQDSIQWHSDGPNMSNVTPDGRYLVFSSANRLTSDEVNANGTQQLFRYDAETGELLRLSVGEHGYNDNGNRGIGDTTFVPANQFLFHAGPTRSDPTMSHDGAYVFFQSPSALTPGALDDVPIDDSGSLALNIYEYHDGHVSLITDGTDTTKTMIGPTSSSVALFGTDVSGQSVFFRTASRLVPQDTDTADDFYDARVGGGFPFTPAPEPCGGDACHGAPVPASPPPAAASVTFTGAVNPSVRRGSAKAAKVRVSVSARTVRATTFFVLAATPAKGRITASGPGLKTVKRTVGKAGAYRLKIALTAKAKRTLKKQHTLKVKVHITYAPSIGTPSTATVSATLKA
jgi:hypothetical protein